MFFGHRCWLYDADNAYLVIVQVLPQRLFLDNPLSEKSPSVRSVFTPPQGAEGRCAPEWSMASGASVRGPALGVHREGSGASDVIKAHYGSAPHSSRRGVL